MVKENPTLVKNMKHVKWRAIPPLKGPDPKGLIKDKKQDKPIKVSLTLNDLTKKLQRSLTYRKRHLKDQ
jgi:hypothetical protein